MALLKSQSMSRIGLHTIRYYYSSPMKQQSSAYTKPIQVGVLFVTCCLFIIIDLRKKDCNIVYIFTITIFIHVTITMKKPLAITNVLSNKLRAIKRKIKMPWMCTFKCNSIHLDYQSPRAQRFESVWALSAAVLCKRIKYKIDANRVYLSINVSMIYECSVPINGIHCAEYFQYQMFIKTNELLRLVNNMQHIEFCIVLTKNCKCSSMI